MKMEQNVPCWNDNCYFVVIIDPIIYVKNKAQ